MPTRNINLTKEMDEFVDASIATGRYVNASEVVRAGLRALEQADQEDKAKLEALRKAVYDGELSGVYEGDVAVDIRAYVQQITGGAV